jgi:hypothetical protein
MKRPMKMPMKIKKTQFAVVDVPVSALRLRRYITVALKPFLQNDDNTLRVGVIVNAMGPSVFRVHVPRTGLLRVFDAIKPKEVAYHEILGSVRLSRPGIRKFNAALSWFVKQRFNQNR